MRILLTFFPSASYRHTWSPFVGDGVVFAVDWTVFGVRIVHQTPIEAWKCPPAVSHSLSIQLTWLNLPAYRLQDLKWVQQEEKLQSQTKLLVMRKVSPSYLLFYATNLFPKRWLCRKKTPSPSSMLLPRGEGRTGTATMFRKMLLKYEIFSTVLSKIVGLHVVLPYWFIVR